MIIFLSLTGVGGLLLGVFMVPLSEIVHMVVFNCLGAYFVFGSYKLYFDRFKDSKQKRDKAVPVQGITNGCIQSAKRRKRRPLADPVVKLGDGRGEAGEMGMGTKSLIGIWLTLMLLLAGAASAQGMGDSRGYDYMGTPVVSEDTQMGEYVNPYAAGRPEWDPYSQGTSTSG